MRRSTYKKNDEVSCPPVPINNSLQSGQSLIEVLISITIVMIVVGSAVGALLLTTSNNTQNRATELATGYEQELMGNLRSLSQSNWSEIYSLPTKGVGGIYYLATSEQLPGTVLVSSSSTSVNGIGTDFDTSLVGATSSYAGDNVVISSLPFTVSTVNNSTSLALSTVYPLQTPTSSINIYRDFSIRPGKETIVANNVTFLRWFSVQNVFRDTCGVGNVTTTVTTNYCTLSTSTNTMTGVLEDPSTQQLTVYITWNGGQNLYKVSQYISRTRDQVIRFNDWSGGVISSTSIFTQPTNQYESESGLNLSTPGALELPTIPSVTSPTSTSITTSGATLGANVTSNGGSALTSVGTCWSTSSTYPISTNCLSTGSTATGVFTQVRTGMPSGTVIYYGGYATNGIGTGYSTEGSFTTL